MAAKDKFHSAVKKGLQKDGWTVTADPLELPYGNLTLLVDLAAERLIAADREGEKIAVEVKSFLNPSAVTDFHQALGQFLGYRLALKKLEPDRRLFLAIPEDAYRKFFQSEFAQDAIAEYGLLLVVYDPFNEVLTQWLR
jgi:XisH protein